MLKNKTILSSLILILIHWLLLPDIDLKADSRSSKQNPNWIVLPIRSEDEFRIGKLGGEGEQHFHGIARSVSNPDIIYLSQDVAQIWKSDNSGKTWQKPLCKNMFVKYGQSIEVDPVNPDIVFTIVEHHTTSSVKFAEKYAGLYRSVDGGISWDLVLKGHTIINRMYQHNIGYDPSTIGKSGAACWYAAFSGNGLYKSEDNGKKWSKILDLSEHNPVYSIQVHPKNKDVFIASNNGLFILKYNSTKPEHIDSLPSGDISSLAINPNNPDMIYVVAMGKGLFQSNDGAKNFKLLKNFDAFQIFLNSGYPQIVYLTGISQNSVISSDGGNTWGTIKAIPPKGLGREWKTKIVGKLTGICPNLKNPNEAVAYSQAAIWKTTDGGKTFNYNSTDFTGFAWSWWNDGAAFDIKNPDRFIFFNCDVGMTYTDNGGKFFEKRGIPFSWVHKTINWAGMYAGDIQPISGSQVIVASAGMYFKTKLVRSEDAGRTWSIVDDEYNNNLFISFHPNFPNIVFAGGKISTDSGKTFNKIDMLSKYNADILGICWRNPDTVYAVSKPRNKILRSSDKGKTWEIYTSVNWQFNGLDSKPIFAVDSENPDIIYTLYRDGDLARYNGKEWVSLGVMKLTGNTQIENYIGSVVVDPRDSKIIYAGLQASGISYIFKSIDGGKNWEDITYNLPRVGVTALSVHPITGDLMHGTAFGTWLFSPPNPSKQSIYYKSQIMNTKLKP